MSADKNDGNWVAGVVVIAACMIVSILIAVVISCSFIDQLNVRLKTVESRQQDYNINVRVQYP